eukprot:CAMPEP_0198291060 /NCGR_PEP_ID=MMETSP1449-20131203/8714_1 /TAXON_ID=420275 /ORGANISM="Attheya septentrionalis, Strain CCMP2084" /LENGTH=192 /DNA_ID=CAMNT_0043989653 /DNA_START=76 /DNA_END=654 /DNA_ORIENTATION=-
MMMNRSLALFAVLATVATVTSGYSTTSRRNAFCKIATTGAAALVVSGSSNIGVANALEMCPVKSENCVTTTWTAPSGMSKADAASALKDALNAYPQEGQGDVDGGGWTLVEDNLSSSAGTARVEYRSSGKKFFAKAFNGGKPFVDDLNIELANDGSSIQLRSASRIGESDFGVNKKRIEYLAAAMKAKGFGV